MKRWVIAVIIVTLLLVAAGFYFVQSTATTPANSAVQGCDDQRLWHRSYGEPRGERRWVSAPRESSSRTRLGSDGSHHGRQPLLVQ